jgi:hypothetical protein
MNGASFVDNIEILNGQITTKGIKAAGIGAGHSSGDKNASSRVGKCVIGGGIIQTNSDNAAGIGSGYAAGREAVLQALTLRGGSVTSPSFGSSFCQSTSEILLQGIVHLTCTGSSVEADITANTNTPAFVGAYLVTAPALRLHRRDFQWISHDNRSGV